MKKYGNEIRVVSNKHLDINTANSINDIIKQLQERYFEFRLISVVKLYSLNFEIKLDFIFEYEDNDDV